MRRFVLLLSLGLSAGCATSLPDADAPVQIGPVAEPVVGPPAGALVLAGGGVLPAEIWSRFVELAGGDTSRIVVITTAGEGDTPSAGAAVERLAYAGSKHVVAHHTRDRAVANSDAFVATIDRATGVWFTGGRQHRLVDAYAGTRTEDALRRVLERGGAIGGSSAGASIQASYLVRGAPEGNHIMMAPGYERGFGYLRNTAVDQHLLTRDRQDDLLEVLEAKPGLLGIGLDEGTAIVVQADHADVIGRSYVAFYDLRHGPASRTSDLDPEAPSRAAPYYFLTAGSAYHLADRRVIQGRALPLHVVTEVEPGFEVEEATIEEIHEAMRVGRLSARSLVERYLERIARYDRRGPTLNALVVVNPRARILADSLDALLRQTGRMVGPLHGIPVIVKDNYDTRDLPTTAGSAVLEGSIPPDDAFQVARIRAAGGIVLAKSNMAEWAFSPYETVGSALPGYTYNPYALNRVPAGSSGGTAAAVAANLGAVGLGTDTGNSIRGPSAHTALVGIRPTMGLTSRDGIVPLYLDRDVGGPMARTVADAAIVLDVIAGADPSDPVTLESGGHIPETYTAFLDRDGLRGARIGVLRQISAEPTADPEVLDRFDAALDVMRRAGATVMDAVEVPGWAEIMDEPLFCSRFHHDINQYLSSLGPRAPVRTLEEIIESRRAHPSVRDRLESLARVPVDYESDERCQRAAANADRLRDAVRRVMTANDLDAIVYPTWDNPPRLVGDLDSPHGNNSWQISPPTGFPALTVPMGWVADGTLPVGLQMLGRPWSEGTLIRLAYAFEQATRFRRPPELD